MYHIKIQEKGGKEHAKIPLAENPRHGSLSGKFGRGDNRGRVQMTFYRRKSRFPPVFLF